MADKRVLFILGAAHSLNHSLFLVLPPLLGEVSEDLNASFQILGTVATLSFLIYGLGSLIGGPLSDRLGGVKVARLSIALSGASTFIFILSNNLHTYAAGMFVLALWASFYHPTSNNLISKAFKKNTAEAMGLHGAAASLGQMFTPTIAYSIGTIFQWRFAYIFFGALSLLAAFLINKIPQPTDSNVEAKSSMLEIFKVPNIWVIILFNLIIGLFSRGIELFYPTFLSINRGYSGQLAAISNSLILLFGVIGQLLGGKAADKYGSSEVLIASTVGVFASVALLLLFPIAPIGVISFIVGYGIAYFSHQPAMTALMGLVSPENLKGAAYGVMFFFAFGLGSFSTMIAGYLADIFNLDTAFWMMAGFSVLSILISLVIRHRIKSSRSLY